MPQDEEYERTACNNLIKEGGRPLYSIDLIDEVAKDPFTHWNMLRPWVFYLGASDPDPVTNPNVDWTVFKFQLNSWLHFRRWQKFNRGEPPDWNSGEYEVIESYNRFLLVFRRRSPTYTEAVKKLLTEYDFTRPFQFHEDPTQQDKLTTWIEYLGWECWLHYRLARRVESMQPKYDAAWKTLQDSNVLRPFETEEYVCSIECAYKHQSEGDQATQAVKSARSAARTVIESVYSDAQNPRDPRLTSAARVQKMTAAQERLEAAEEALQTIKRRNDLCTIFMQAAGSYLCTKEDAQRHKLRVMWTLEQVPLVEAELGRSKAVEIGPDVVCGTKRKHSHHEDDEAAQTRSVKKQRLNVNVAGPTLGCEPGLGYQGAKFKRRHDNAAETAADNRPPSKRSKRKGDDNPGANGEILDDADMRSAGNSQDSGTTRKPGRRSSNGRIARTTKRPSPKGGRPSNDRLPRRSTRDTAQASTYNPPPRRSARIAAQQEAQFTTRSGAANPKARVRKRHKP